jgi:hypothetical protein
MKAVAALVLALSVSMLGLAGCEPKTPKPKTTFFIFGVAYAEPPPQDQTFNAALSAKVKAALAGDVGLKTLKIDVDTKGNTVTLKGAVDTAETRRRAEEVARKVKGVHGVKNELTVQGG